MSETKRRDFLKILGIGSAAGMSGCVSKTAPEALVPYVTPPEQAVRGHAAWYRTTCRECPAGCGVEARVREGRVHKLEGNPEHPVNGGGLCPRGQAAVQGLYNPDRLRTPLIGGKPAQWNEALNRLTMHPPDTILTGAVAGALDAAAEAYARRHLRYEPFAYEAVRRANQACFGLAQLPVLRFAEARTIYVFGAGVLETHISPVGYARGIAEARGAGGRLVFIGPRLSATGARADQWIPVRPGDEARLALALAKELAPAGSPLHKAVEPFGAPVLHEELRSLAREISAGPFLAVAGDDEATALAVNLLNASAGALNRTVTFDRASALDRASSSIDLADSRSLLILDCNPVYSLPGFAEQLRKVPFVAVLSSWRDETVEAGQVVLPIHTALESWNEYEPWTGIHCLQQPAMQPVFETRDAGDILTGKSFREFVAARCTKEPFETALARGGWWEDVPTRKVELKIPDLAPVLRHQEQPYTLQTYPSPAHFDGRGANRPWLQELPDPITLAVWDTWAEVNPRDAEKLGIRTGDRLSLSTAHGRIETAAYVYPGVLPGVVAMPLGQGHTAYGRYATGVGVNAALLGPPGGALEIRKLPARADLVTISGHDLQEHREIARSGPLEKEHEEEMSLYPEHAHPKHHWGMTIDLDACTACGACIVACYAENNLPVVGKAEVGHGREMSWIRLERFFGPGHQVSNPFQIDWTMMLCQQCDHAPCEPVCPVFAAYHNEEGLNGQVYNRCVGTRYCSNNCPYKTRRFNWYEAEWPAPLDWQLNPDVTVRSKGVMEKCTFCVQRIVYARRYGGEPVPACAQSCPTRAIAFGDLNDPASRVSQLRARGYRVLEELNTRPAVTYLPRVRKGLA